MKRILLFLLIPVRLLAQDFTGTWTGWIEVGGIDLPYELVVFETGSGLEGYAMTSVIMDDVKNTGIKTIKFSIRKNKLQLEDDELVFSDFSKPPKRNILAAELSLEGSGPTPELSGAYRTRSLDMRDRTSYTGKIFLKKTKEGEFSELTARLKDMKLFPLKERYVHAEELIAKTSQELSEMNKKESRKKPTEESGKSTKGAETAGEINGKVASSGHNAGNPGKTSGKTAKNSAADNRMASAAGKPDENMEKVQEKDMARTPASDGKEKPGGSRQVQEMNSAGLVPAAYLSSRRIEVIHDYYFTGDSLEITFYDNGTVDGDTITVLLDRKLIIPGKLLSTEPLTEIIRIPKNTDSLELIMYAENLGAYPPNTGILIIKDGKSRVDIRFAGDLSRSASVMLRRKK